MGQIAKLPHFFGLDLALAIGRDGLGLLHDPLVKHNSSFIYLSSHHLPNFAKSEASGVFLGQNLLFSANRLDIFLLFGVILADFPVKMMTEIHDNVIN